MRRYIQFSAYNLLFIAIADSEQKILFDTGKGIVYIMRIFIKGMRIGCGEKREIFMHMANELISVPVAGGTIVLAAGGLGWICGKVRQEIASEKIALMGVLGAFVFAAQMVNFQLPMMPGTSGHLIGAVFLAMLLGPHLAAIVLASVVIIQCLLFQDGGLLATGCNILNIAIVPSYVGYFVYRAILGDRKSKPRLLTAVVLACILAAEAGSVLVVVEAAISKVMLVPVGTFLATMGGVHLLAGTMEGLITVAILSYLTAVRPDLITQMTGRGIFSRKAAIISLAVITIITAAGFSLLASSKPDGLEWSYLERPDQPGFKPVVANEDLRIQAADEFQSKIALMPDYSARGASKGHPVSAGWTSLAGILGSVVCMGAIWLLARLLRPAKIKT
jgi:cobalt/nickel transport system permease protein